MERKEFLEMLEEYKGQNLSIEIEGKEIQKKKMNDYAYVIIDDRLYIKNSKDLDFVVINSNIIRNIKNNSGDTILYIDDKSETKIKLSVI